MPAPHLYNLLMAAVDGRAHLDADESAAYGPTSSWSIFGVRDPSLLTDPLGRPIVSTTGEYTMYFNGRDRSVPVGGKTRIGMATGTVTEGWRANELPVFEDGNYAAQGSVVRLAADHHRMYYSANTLEGFSLAESVDGIRWQRFIDASLPTPAMFGIRRMGLPYVLFAARYWYMVFEGMALNQFQIYMARSEDGLQWSPVNGGRPIHQPCAGAWDNVAQANPSLYAIAGDDGAERYFILYNGCAEAHGWDLGVMVSDSLAGPWRACDRPMLSRAQTRTWSAGRIEGARLVHEPARTDVLFFGLPTSDSYANGKIHLAKLVPDIPQQQADLEATNLRAEQKYNDALAKRYFEVWDTYPIQRFTSNFEAEVIAGIAGHGCDVLVVGSGGGRELPLLIERGCRITAVDISEGMLAAGQSRYPSAAINWVLADVHALPLQDKSADLLLGLGAVFNYLHTPGRFLSEARRVLRPGGAVLLAVLNAAHASEPKGRQVLKDGRLRMAYVAAELQDLMSKADLKVQAIYGVRHFVDLLPADWNRAGTGSDLPGPAALAALLKVESVLSTLLPAVGAKFLLLHAIRSPDESSFASGTP